MEIICNNDTDLRDEPFIISTKFIYRFFHCRKKMECYERLADEYQPDIAGYNLHHGLVKVTPTCPKEVFLESWQAAVKQWYKDNNEDPLDGKSYAKK